MRCAKQDGVTTLFSFGMTACSQVTWRLRALNAPTRVWRDAMSMHYEKAPRFQKVEAVTGGVTAMENRVRRNRRRT